MRFKDRFQAGQLLAKELTAHKGRDDAVILALPRGGVLVGYEVAKVLRLPLDVLVIRKVGLPDFPEMAIGALASGGLENISTSAVEHFDVSTDDLQRVIAMEREELLRRELCYRGDRPFPELKKKTVILVDDGLATGRTMATAIMSVRRHSPQEIIVAVPVGARQICQRLAREADQVICLYTPAYFDAVGTFYMDFSQVADDDVVTLLSRAAEEQKENNHTMDDQSGRNGPVSLLH